MDKDHAVQARNKATALYDRNVFQVDEWVRKATAFEKDLAKAMKEKSQLQEALDGVQAELSAAKAHLVTAWQEKAEAKTGWQATKGELSEAKQDLADTKQARKESADSHLKELLRVRRQLAMAQDAEQSLAQSLQREKQKAGRLALEVAQNKSAIASLQNTVKEKDTTIKTMDNKVQALAKGQCQERVEQAQQQQRDGQRRHKERKPRELRNILADGNRGGYKDKDRNWRSRPRDRI